MNKDDFYGKVYKSVSGSTITVLHYLEDVPKSKRIYKVECSVCSKDKELWKDINVSRKSVIDSRVSCDCGKPTYTMQQLEVKASRKCKELGLTLHKVYKDNERPRRKQRVVYIDCNNKTNDVSYENFMARNPVINKYLHPDKFYIEAFYKLRSDKSVILCRESSQSWLFWCEECQKHYDDISLEENAIFKTKGGSLLKGVLGCHCNGQASLSEEYIVCNISKLLKFKEGKFLELVEYNNSASYIKWECEEGHINISKYDNLLSGKGCSRCRDLYKSGNRLYEKYIDETDYLYIMSLVDTDGYLFYKIGRSFDVSKRLNNISVSYKNVSVLKTFKGIHSDIYRLEGLLINSLVKDNRYKPNIWFAGSTECFSYDEELLADLYRCIEGLKLTLQSEDGF